MARMMIRLYVWDPEKEGFSSFTRLALATAVDGAKKNNMFPFSWRECDENDPIETDAARPAAAWKSFDEGRVADGGNEVAVMVWKTRPEAAAPITKPAPGPKRAPDHAPFWWTLPKIDPDDAMAAVRASAKSNGLRR
jgi:hypothetical protein